MSKKRVHELAKELGLDNREAVVALQAAGVQVKTHSSSVYEEEAMSVLKKVATPPPPAAPAVGRRPGMMIVKKRAVEPEGEAATAAQMVQASLAPEATAAAETARPESVPVAAAHLPAAAVLSASAAAPSGSQSTPEAAPAARASQPIGALPAQLSRAGSADQPDAPQPAATPADVPAAAQAGAQTGAAEPAAAAAAAPTTEMPRRPSTPGSATVVRMIDRDKLLERVPGRRLGGGGRPEVRRAPPARPAQPAPPVPASARSPSCGWSPIPSAAAARWYRWAATRKRASPPAPLPHATPAPLAVVAAWAIAAR